MKIIYKLTLGFLSIVLLIASNIFYTIPIFSEEVSMTSEDMETIQEEIRWLQAEAFDLEVTLVSRKPEKLSEAAAAVYVITQESIRRSGATSIPEVLRMVPGLQVARVHADIWAITSRGFNTAFAQKLLVLIDGRSVYTPLFAGVYWDVQNVMLEDVERIEVIRGPGGTLWGANAVNGIINIMTKNSKDTQGGLLTGTVGFEEEGVGGFRYGGKIGKDAYYRLFARYFDHGNFVDAGDGKWDIQHGGWQIDWNMSSVDSLTLQGNLYDGDLDLLSRRNISRNTDVSGGNMLGRWKHIFSDTSDMKIQMYYDRTYRKTQITREIRDTFDLDTQHRFRLGSLNEIIWGIGYRYTTDDIVGFRTLQLNPDSKGDHLFSAFVQDEISFFGDRLKLIFGTKIEHNDYTAVEIQPNARVLWRLSQNQRIWFAFSQAVRTPTRMENDRSFVMAGRSSFGTQDFRSEDLNAYELGYRIQPLDNISIDITGFYNVYDNLPTFEEGELFTENKMDGEAYGLEISANWNVTDYWKLTAGYTYLKMHLRFDETSSDTRGFGVDEEEGQNPRNQAQLLSYLDLPYGMEFDTFLYYVDHLGTFVDIPSYLRLDARLGWKPTESLDLSIGIRNMLDGEHLEFGLNPSSFGIEVERSVYGSITWRF